MSTPNRQRQQPISRFSQRSTKQYSKNSRDQKLMLTFTINIPLDEISSFTPPKNTLNYNSLTQRLKDDISISVRPLKKTEFGKTKMKSFLNDPYIVDNRKKKKNIPKNHHQESSSFRKQTKNPRQAVNRQVSILQFEKINQCEGDNVIKYTTNNSAELSKDKQKQILYQSYQKKLNSSSSQWQLINVREIRKFQLQVNHKKQYVNRDYLMKRILIVASAKKIQRAWRKYRTNKLIKSYSQEGGIKRKRKLQQYCELNEINTSKSIFKIKKKQQALMNQSSQRKMLREGQGERKQTIVANTYQRKQIKQISQSLKANKAIITNKAILSSQIIKPSKSFFGQKYLQISQKLVQRHEQHSQSQESSNTEFRKKKLEQFQNEIKKINNEVSQTSSLSENLSPKNMKELLQYRMLFQQSFSGQKQQVVINEKQENTLIFQTENDLVFTKTNKQQHTKQSEIMRLLKNQNKNEAKKEKLQDGQELYNRQQLINKRTTQLNIKIPPNTNKNTQDKKFQLKKREEQTIVIENNQQDDLIQQMIEKQKKQEILKNKQQNLIKQVLKQKDESQRITKLHEKLSVMEQLDFCKNIVELLVVQCLVDMSQSETIVNGVRFLIKMKKNNSQKPEGICTNLESMKDYLENILNYMFERQIHKDISRQLKKPLGLENSQILNFLRYKTDKPPFKEVIPTKHFENHWNYASQNIYFDVKYEDQSKQRERVLYLKSLTKVPFQKCLDIFQINFDGFNESLCFYRPYGLLQKPYPWQCTTRIPKKQLEFKKTMKLGYQRLQQCSKVLCGLLFEDKKGKIDLQVANEIRQQRMNSLLQIQFENDCMKWQIISDEKTLQLLQLGELVLDVLVIEFISELNIIM